MLIGTPIEFKQKAKLILAMQGNTELATIRYSDRFRWYVVGFAASEGFTTWALAAEHIVAEHRKQFLTQTSKKPA